MPSLKEAIRRAEESTQKRRANNIRGAENARDNRAFPSSQVSAMEGSFVLVTNKTLFH